MADIIINYFDDMILLIPEDWEFTKFYPSPEQMKNKIILKHKGKLNLAYNYRLRLNKS